VQGYWDVDQNGRYIGTAGHNRYSYDETSQGRTHSLVAFKQNVNSGLKRRLTAHCHASLSANELSKVKRKFMRAVVKGGVAPTAFKKITPGQLSLLLRFGERTTNEHCVQNIAGNARIRLLP
jgi:hypothetical protein